MAGPTYPCWRCGEQILYGCTHGCPTPATTYAATTDINWPPDSLESDEEHGDG